VGSTLAFAFKGHRFESEYRLFSHHGSLAISKLRSPAKCSLDDSVRRLLVHSACYPPGKASAAGLTQRSRTSFAYIQVVAFRSAIYISKLTLTFNPCRLQHSGTPLLRSVEVEFSLADHSSCSVNSIS